MAYKMNGFSGFGNSPIKQTKGPKMPKDHPVTPPTEKQSGKGTVRPRTTEDRIINAISGSWPYRAMAELERRFSGKSKSTKKK